MISTPMYINTIMLAPTMIIYQQCWCCQVIRIVYLSVEDKSYDSQDRWAIPPRPPHPLPTHLAGVQTPQHPTHLTLTPSGHMAPHGSQGEGGGTFFRTSFLSVESDLWVDERLNEILIKILIIWWWFGSLTGNGVWLSRPHHAKWAG